MKIIPVCSVWINVLVLLQTKSILAQAGNNILSSILPKANDNSLSVSKVNDALLSLPTDFITSLIRPNDDDTSLSLPINDDGSFNLPTDFVASLLNNDTINLEAESTSEDAKLNFTELAIKYGYECEEHDVITEDGYILKLFNVKGDKSKPVFIMHGLIDSSDTFIMKGNNSLALTLAKNGYDVWAGNCRGNKYSQRHLTLDPKTDKRAFWNFSQHEFGTYDLPAMIDYVLNKTGETQLQTIGHSQGTAIFYILTAEKPEYNDKIKLFIALAPICYLHNVKGVIRTVVALWPVLGPQLQLLGIQELFSRNSTLIKFIEFLCTRKIIGYPICSTVIFAGAGSDRSELEQEFLPTLFGHYPDAASIKNGNHLVQVALKKRFSKYDYGLIKNIEVYGSVSPPNYNLENVRMPVALLVGENDNLSTIKDVELLRAQLSNVVEYHVMEKKQFNHIDFVWGTNMNEYLYPLVLDLLQKHQNNTLTSS